MTAALDRGDGALADWRGDALDLEHALNAAVLGQEEVIRLLLICVFARGHVLLEGDVGVGKTTLLRALARGIGGAFERVEGTIDLMPTDLVYHTYVSKDGRPRVDHGPLLRHAERLSVFFFNEINRARPHVHSLMLRAMAERSVSAFNEEHRFPHLLVFADRNRVEKDETFELPAAARDRFLMELNVQAPSDPDTLRRLLADVRFHDADVLVEEVAEGRLRYDALGDFGARLQRDVHTSEAIERYALALGLATHDPGRFGVAVDGVDMDALIQAGSSPRGMSYLLRAARVGAWLDGREHVLPEDLHRVFAPCIAHRIFLTPVYELRREVITRELVTGILQHVAAP